MAIDWEGEAAKGREAISRDQASGSYEKFAAAGHAAFEDNLPENLHGISLHAPPKPSYDVDEMTSGDEEAAGLSGKPSATNGSKSGGGRTGSLIGGASMLGKAGGALGVAAAGANLLFNQQANESGSGISMFVDSTQSVAESMQSLAQRGMRNKEAAKGAKQSFGK